MRKGNKAVSLLDTKRKLRKWELRGFFCTAMILKFHASLLYFSMIQCKSHQSLWLIGHKDTKRKLRKWELRGFFCTAMILKFHASLLYFSMIQCKSHQSLWLIGHKQRDVQYITVQH